MDKSVPIPDAVTAFYWEAACRGELVVQGFEGSDVLQFPPQPVAEGVPGPVGASIPVPVSGRGSLYAYTVLHQAFHPAYADSGPLVLALTELDDAPGIRILTNLVEVDPSELVVDMALEVVFEDRGEFRIPQFRPVREEGTA
ncbi:Zn-ribbon domain-containing OB-fold protein [Rhodococcus gannanensis]|uniref:Zn-ribbon domain-containing OB-fold protein n=1 Tax=Rhodococcus gannanensis TaxID=1960308 RepID=A0ABW4P687_9NOCA